MRPAGTCFDVLKTVLSSGFAPSFSIFFLPYNECLSSISFRGFEFRWFFCVRVAGFLVLFFLSLVHEEPGEGGCHQPTLQFRCPPFLLYNLGWGIFDKV